MGAALNLGALALLHFEIAPSSARRYLVPNLLGSIILVVTAWLDAQWASAAGGSVDGRADQSRSATADVEPLGLGDDHGSVIRHREIEAPHHVRRDVDTAVARIRAEVGAGPERGRGLSRVVV